MKPVLNKFAVRKYTVLSKYEHTYTHPCNVNIYSFRYNFAILMTVNELKKLLKFNESLLSFGCHRGVIDGNTEIKFGSRTSKRVAEIC